MPASDAGSDAAAPAGAMGASASAPTLQNSPYTQTIGKPMRKPKVWVPPPGAFNEPDLPRFVNPGPGRYTPMEQHSCLSTKPRAPTCRFGSEDRFKYFGPQTPLETLQSGMMGGLFQPQNKPGPGPGYLPSYDAVRPRARASSFTVERRDPGGVEKLARGSAPGPGLYNPSDKTLSRIRDYTAGGGFLADDRQKYLGQVDPASLTPVKSYSPGPMYKPSETYSRKRATTVSFGGHGPGTIMKPPSLKAETPGPGSYTPTTQNACLSTKPRVLAKSFSIEQRGGKTLMDSSQCFHGKVPVDMTHASAGSLSPGPGYNPSFKSVIKSSSQPIIGTAKRFRDYGGL
jgi:hypothetical protein